MRINTEWLRELAPVDLSARELSRLLTRLGFEVEEAHFLDTALDGVRMGRLLSRVPHPAAEGMYVCTLDLGEGAPRQIVAASEHPLSEGWIVPVALPGTTLPTGIPVKEGRFRGENSQGMICLDRELGVLPRGSGLSRTDDAGAIGRLASEVFGFQDALLGLNILPNRPDCMGLVGLAREVAAATGVALIMPAAGAEASGEDPGVDVDLLDPAGCPRYTARAVLGCRVGKSPMWLSSRLVLAGLRPINNVVDITNLVLYEQGQPMHAFDRARLAGGRIVVRRAGDDEKLTLLGGAEISLSSLDLVIADGERPVALAGVMGGADSGVTTDTVDVVLECAHFDPIGVRRASRRHAVRTDSSARFERGTDPNSGLQVGIARAEHLMVQVAGGRLSGPRIDLYPSRRERRVLHVPTALVNGTLGTELDRAEIEGILGGIGYDILDGERVAAPTWRADAVDPVVAIEDVARHHGYDAVEAAPPRQWVVGHAPPALDRARARLRAALMDQGWWEARTFPLEDAARLAHFTGSGEPLRIENPASAEMAVLRSSLEPRVLDVLQHNHRRHRRPQRFFEIDRVHDGTTRDGRWTCVIAGTGPAVDEWWTGEPPALDLHRLKGAVENALVALGLSDVSCEPTEIDWLHPGAAARVLVGGREVGLIGTLHPRLKAAWDLPKPVQMARLDVEALAEASETRPRSTHAGYSRFPAVSRDLSLIVSKAVLARDLSATIRQAGGALLEELRCFDDFEGGAIPQGQRCISFALRFRDPDATLTAEQAAVVEARIVDALAARHGAALRGV